MIWGQVVPPDELPVSVATIRANARFDLTEEDALIEGYIRAAAEYAQAYTGLAIEEQIWDLFLDSFPSGELVIPLAPVQRILSVAYRSGGVSQIIAADGYALYGERLTAANGWPTVDSAPDAVAIRFVTGVETAPSIRQAIILLASHWLNNREAAGDSSLAAIPFGVTCLLDINRRMFV